MPALEIWVAFPALAMIDIFQVMSVANDPEIAIRIFFQQPGQRFTAKHGSTVKLIAGQEGADIAWAWHV